jgi:hypothetical protein
MNFGTSYLPEFGCYNQYRQSGLRAITKPMHILRRPKPSARADKSALNNAQSLSDPIILGLNEGHNKRLPFSSMSIAAHQKLGLVSELFQTGSVISIFKPENDNS